ncbi:LysM peptidoglycan-binding domain-containing protein [Streptomyces sp. HPF1205]|uniref:LysM peptidoglycan-binding domain-containing protein n=1 Tax=Streptomyces sp. HPF1205 TaxID=2873262 RepID=UPI001CEC2806|nr:LysM peptidoglycan-binding domain-containing protein [Streptomyces sp. HPF1205]
MPKHAFNRPKKTRLISTRGAVVVGTFAALTCGGIVTGTAHAATAAPATATTASTTASHTWHTAHTTPYTVKAGDTLIGIARAHKVPGGWHAIARINKISRPYTIYPGQVLRLPTWWHHTSTTAPAAPAAKPATAASTSTVKAVPASATTSTGTGTATAGSQSYPNNLTGWINHSLAIMKQHGIPGSYNGIYRNVMRESSGNPNAINLWDSNAAAGHPSIGLLQVIQPTFNAYHVAGTSFNIYDPVANITAACNYAYHVYGSIDNVNGPY